MAAIDFLDLDPVEELETIPMTRRQLYDLMTQLFVAQGSSIKDAERHAKMRVDAYFLHIKWGHLLCQS